MAKIGKIAQKFEVVSLDIDNKPVVKVVTTTELHQMITDLNGRNNRTTIVITKQVKQLEVFDPPSKPETDQPLYN